MRPAFYLNTNTQFESGSGSEGAPFTGAYVYEPEIEVTVNGGTIINNSDYGARADVIVAYYCTNGVLKTVSSETVDFAPKGENGDTHTVSFEGSDAHKVFVWDSFKRMKPFDTNEAAD